MATPINACSPLGLQMSVQDLIEALAVATAREVVSQLGDRGRNSDRRLFTIPQAAIYLGRTRKAVEHLIARGTIQVTRLDGKVQIDRSSLDKLIDAHTYYEAA